jgi:thiamine kinase-like enzyme
MNGGVAVPDGDSRVGDEAARYANVQAALPQVACLRDRPCTVTLLDGGLTNTNARVRTPERDVVVRVSRMDSTLLAIDRRVEYLNSLAAARSGASPAVVDRVPEKGILVVEYIDGRTLTDADLDDEATLQRVATSCRTLHAGPRFVNDFDMFKVQRRYLDTVVAQGFRLPPRYLEFLPQVRRIEAALSAYPIATVPCNNDLLAANFVDDGRRIWIIDFEYSGNNDPCFELGNIWSEATLPLEHLESLVTAYFGGPRPELAARARLLGLMSKYGWTLWASIQDATSDIDFDFWRWGMQKYDRAVAEFDGPGFERLLDAAAQHMGGTACTTRAV